MICDRAGERFGYGLPVHVLVKAIDDFLTTQCEPDEEADMLTPVGLTQFGRPQRNVDRLTLEDVLKRLSAKGKPASNPLAASIAPVEEDWTILHILSKDNAALSNVRILAKASKLLLEDKKHDPEKRLGIVRLSVWGLRQRMPALEELGYISRPTGRDGKVLKRKGIAMTPLGRSAHEQWLSQCSP
jgi:hypothetical protein